MSKSKIKHCVLGLDWKFEKICNKDGTSGNKYYYKGTLAKKILLSNDNNLIKRIAGYTLILHDLNMILCWLQIITDEYKKLGIHNLKLSNTKLTPDNFRSRFDLIKAFWVASFSFYGKLFTQADGRKIKLGNDIFGSNEDFKRTHNDLITYRHNFAAHSGKEYVEYVEVFLLLDSLSERKTQPFIVRTMTQPDGFQMDFIKDFEAICKFLHGKVKIKINELDKTYLKNLTPQLLETMYHID